MAAWHGPALAHPDAAALEVLTGVMVSGGGGRGGGGGTGRLYKALVDGKKALDGPHGRRGTARSRFRDRDRDARRRSIARRSAQSDDGYDRGRRRGSADARRGLARQDAHPAGHGDADGQLAAGGPRPVRDHRGRRLAPVLRQLRPGQSGHAGGSRPRRPALLQAVQPHGRLFHPDVGPRSDRRARVRRPRRAPAQLQDRAVGVGRRSLRFDARQRRKAPRASDPAERDEGRDALEGARAATRSRPRSSCASATRSRWPDCVPLPSSRARSSGAAP